MHLTFIQDLAVVMLVAGVVTLLFHRLKLPVVLGYLLAGLIIGPHTLRRPLISGEGGTAEIDIMAQLGIVFLMFSLGMHFSLRKLFKVGATAFAAGALELVLMVFVGYELGRLFGLRTPDCLFLGAILSISSSTIIAKTLRDLGRSRETFAQIIFGILVVEDILAIAMIALLSTIVIRGTMEVQSVIQTLARLAIFLSVVLVAGLLVVPALLKHVARFRSREMLLITALALCFGVTLLAAKLGYSLALGAFLIGAIVAESRESSVIEGLIEPLRDMFSAVFFVAVGMQIDPAMVREHAPIIAAGTLAVIAGKIVTASCGVFIAGRGGRTALRVGMGMAQIGEFSFVIAQLARELDPRSGFLYPIAVSVSATTTLIFPYLLKGSDGVVSGLERVLPAGVRNYFELYTRWIQPKLPARAADPIRHLIRKTVLQVSLNLAIVTGVFVTAAYLAQRFDFFWRWLPRWTGGSSTLFWLAAMLACLPLLAATLRKLRAMALLLAELSVPPSLAQRHTPLIRTIIANTILGSGVASLALILLVLSSAILPPWPILIVLLLAIVGIAVSRWRHFIQLYARAQFALGAALSAPLEPSAAEAGAEAGGSSGNGAGYLPPIPGPAAVVAMVIPRGSPAAGKRLRDFPLRTRTGVSAVAIERDGQSIINPGPADELRAGDKMFVLGDPEQIRAARELLGA
jgi:CPA2 family monovalent cation:H+ antiporter-2